MRLPTAQFRTVLADPPWMEQGQGRTPRGANAHYGLLRTDEIIRTMASADVWGRVADRAHMYLWATNNHLTDALKVMDALGFRHVTAITWAKMARDGQGWKAQHPGLGQYFCGLTEHMLFGVRGPAARPDPADRGVTLLTAPRREHSRKPDEQYGLIERVSPGPRLEMFARGPARPGWTTWGDQAR